MRKSVLCHSAMKTGKRWHTLGHSIRHMHVIYEQNVTLLLQSDY